MLILLILLSQNGLNFILIVIITLCYSRDDGGMRISTVCDYEWSTFRGFCP